jgi:threonine aldolase
VLAKVITFDMLSDLVTDVLVSMREILATNNSANAYVYGTTTATTDTATTTTTTTTETED